MTWRDLAARFRDILNPWGALREARVERDRLVVFMDVARQVLDRTENERDALRAEVDRLKRAPKRDAKGRFVA